MTATRMAQLRGWGRSGAHAIHPAAEQSSGAAAYPTAHGGALRRSRGGVRQADIEPEVSPRTTPPRKPRRSTAGLRFVDHANEKRLSPRGLPTRQGLRTRSPEERTPKHRGDRDDHRSIEAMQRRASLLVPGAARWPELTRGRRRQ